MHGKSLLMTPTISEADARALVRLIAEVAALNTDHDSAKRHLMDGLATLIDADCWIWTLSYLHPEKPPVYASLQDAGFDEERFGDFLQTIEHPGMRKLTAPFARELLSGKGEATHLDQRIDPVGRFSARDVDPWWLAADVAPLILSAQPLNDECVSLIGLYRHAHRPLFSERENRMAHILLTEVPWLHATSWQDNGGGHAPSLSRSRRLVLNLLLEGHSRKMVADQLNLSIHTVGDYVKDIYRTFGVQSHAELIRRFSRGDCNDGPPGAPDCSALDAAMALTTS
jgi:DNA-binding CsgD family transcriptional regulator